MLIMEQSKHVIIRQGSEADMPLILQFFNKEYPQYRRDSEFWNWINISLGDANSLITIAECDGKVVGHYCIIPRTLLIDNTEYSVGMGIHAIVDVEYRKYVSIVEITNHTKKLAKEFGMVMLYGFPNQNYHIIQEKIERWNVVSRFDAIVYNNSDLESEIELHSVPNLGKMQFTSLFSNMKTKKSTIRLKNSISYYYERYINHPHSIYKPYLVYKDSKLNGFVILKVYDNKLGHIIDFYVKDTIDMSELIKSSMSKLNVDTITLWETNVDFKNALQSLDLNTTNGFRTNFLVKFLDSDFENTNKSRILDINNWDLPMGTSDAF